MPRCLQPSCKRKQLVAVGTLVVSSSWAMQDVYHERCVVPALAAACLFEQARCVFMKILIYQEPASHEGPRQFMAGALQGLPRYIRSITTRTISLGLQIAQSRSYLYTLGPKVGNIYILGALGYVWIMQGHCIRRPLLGVPPYALEMSVATVTSGSLSAQRPV